MALNHFKSKGSAPTSQAQQTNFDQGDGQGAWNALRVQQAQRLAVLLAGLRQDPEGDGWCLAEADGRLQWLFAIYRVMAFSCD